MNLSEEVQKALVEIENASKELLEMLDRAMLAVLVTLVVNDPRPGCH